MAGDKFDQLYNALKADGAVTGTREHFRKFVYAPGKQGYHNRKQLYDALHADGAVSSNSYEEFAQRLGLHAVNPKPQQKPVAQQKPITTAQRAMQVPHRLKTQLGKAQKSAPKSASPFVHSLYEIDEAQKGAGYPVDYTSPNATQQVYQRNQRIRRHGSEKSGSDDFSNPYQINIFRLLINQASQNRSIDCSCHCLNGTTGQHSHNAA